ncbi:hypothetical protein NKI79_32555 [Mesorhizobium sp. M0340]|uniref:hypothetical protein n=1 Tax=Mesorhizobium sp. M0340 TaxID=2956939 RepID=UPI003335099F
MLLPQDEERDARLLELDGKIGPVRLCAPPRALFDTIASEEFVLKRVIGQLAWQGPAQPDCRCALQIIQHRTACYSQHDRNLAGAGPASGKPKHLSQLSHGQSSLCRHQNLLVPSEVFDAKVADPGGNLQCRKLAGLWLERWPASYRNAGRCLIGMAAGFTSESAVAGSADVCGAGKQLNRSPLIHSRARRKTGVATIELDGGRRLRVESDVDAERSADLSSS